VRHHPEHLKPAEVNHAVILHDHVQKSELDINVWPVKAGTMDLIDGRSSPAGPASGHLATPGGCPQCACPDAQKIVSRHLTTDGLLTYTRCQCGALHLWLWPLDTAAARHVARSH
jgi:hypothetical protein